MKKTSEHWDEQDKTDKSDDSKTRPAKTRDVGTIVGFKSEFALPLLSRWANRFIIAAIVQGALAAGLTAYLLASGIGWLGGVEASRIVAAGGAGTWLTVGYLVYIMLGPIGVAVTALFYQHLETHLQSFYTGRTRLLAWLHLVLMNVGVVGATWLMMNAGYRGGTLNANLLAQGLTASAASGQVHTQVMQYYPPYIAAFIAIAILGTLAGGLGYVIIWRRSMKLPVRPWKQP